MLPIVPRAERVGLLIPITYRVAGDEEWFQSRVVNISESGVLFGPTTLTPGTLVEVILSAPIPVGSMIPGKHVCTGQVVRTTEVGVVGARFGKRRFLLES